MQYTFEEFMNIIRKLRMPEGCPWDKEQTHESLRPCILEEAYEVVDSIDNQDISNLKEELGDVLLQIAMHSVIGEEKGEFTIGDVITDVAQKMIRRHPHVFGSISVEDSQEVLNNWEEIKRQEKEEVTHTQGMKRIPKALPANIRAAKVQKKAAKTGFDFPDCEQALGKVYEELEELVDAIKTKDNCKVEEEYGDLMFSLINLSRFLEINAENSLTNATNKFINRFEGIECLANEAHQNLCDLTIEQMNDLWERVK